MKKILIKLFVFLILFSCQVNRAKKESIENYILSEKDNNWALNGIGYYLNVENFVDTNKDGIGDIQGIINNIEYFKSESKNSIDIDFIILGNIFNEDNSFNKRIGNENDFYNLAKIANKKNIKILLDISIDIKDQNYYNFIEKNILKGIAGFRIDYKDIESINSEEKHQFLNSIRTLKEKYSYLFIFSRNNFSEENIKIDAIESLNNNIASIEFNNNINNIITFKLNNEKYIDILPKLIFTIPQIPVIQSGYEFGLVNSTPSLIERNINDRDNNNIFRSYKESINVRRKFNINLYSKFIFHSNDSNIFSFFIINEDKKYFIVINKNNFLSLCYLKNGEWIKYIDTKKEKKEFVLVEMYGDSVNTKYYIPKNNLNVFCNIKDSGLKIFEIINE